MVKILILSNGGVFLAQIVAWRPLLYAFGLDTGRPFELWRYGSYLFLHGGPVHLLFNMFLLWMLGSDLEEHFGPRKFLRYYFFTGVGAGLLQVLASRLPGQPPSIIVGASGAIFGLLLAYGIVFAERTITLLLFFVLPLTMKAKHLALLLGAVELVFAVSPGSSGIARFAHLGGMAFGYLYLKAPPGLLSSRGGSRLRSIRDRWETARRTSEDRRMDDLLRKVTERGIQSLTEEEKEFLHRMSRRKKWH